MPQTVDLFLYINWNAKKVVFVVKRYEVRKLKIKQYAVRNGEGGTLLPATPSLKFRFSHPQQKLIIGTFSSMFYFDSMVSKKDNSTAKYFLIVKQEHTSILLFHL